MPLSWNEIRSRAAASAAGWQGMISEDADAPSVHRFRLAELPDNIHRFAFIAGYRTQHIRESDPINQEAVVAVGQLHDALKRDNYTGEKLEIFLVRLLFCLFADDTGIFQPKDSFHDLIEFHTHEDGSDVGAVLAETFGTLNEKPENRQSRLAEHFARFPHVNGKLFEANHRPPQFDGAMRKQLLSLCAMNWGAISPAIFGAMFQTVIELEATDRRRELGAHYTSEANILKQKVPASARAMRWRSIGLNLCHRASSTTSWAIRLSWVQKCWMLGKGVRSNR